MSYLYAASDAAPAAPAALARSGQPHKRVWRWSVVLAATIALHGAAFVWFARHRDISTLDAVKPPVQVALLTAQPIAREAGVRRAVPPSAGPAAPQPGRPRRPAPVLSALAPEPSAPAAAAPTRETDASTTKFDAASAAGASPASNARAATPTGADATSAGVRFSVPPSGNLHYNTFYNGVENAPGTIRWASEGDRYEMMVSVPLPFVGAFSYRSRGHIDAFGLAPEHYAEKRGRRPEDVTTFDRAAKRIGFTRTSATQALPDGAQDRFSMVMQLASLVRANPDAYQSGVTRAFYVADDDSAEIWPIETIGDESIRTAEGFIEARHFMRLPRHDGDRRRIDVWLAPALGWLPARIVQTEPNGSQFELVWRGPLAPPGAENASAKGKTADDSSEGGSTDMAPIGPREHP